MNRRAGVGAMKKKRADVSMFMVHLTRDDRNDRTEEEGGRRTTSRVVPGRLPLVNVMHNGHDFAWEREWRVIGDVAFDFGDLVCVILPEDEYELRDRMARIGVPAIDPAWGYEKVILELATQQRSTKKVWKAVSPPTTPKLKRGR